MSRGFQKEKGEKKKGKGKKQRGTKALELMNFPLLYTQESTKEKNKTKTKVVEPQEIIELVAPMDSVDFKEEEVKEAIEAEKTVVEDNSEKIEEILNDNIITDESMADDTESQSIETTVFVEEHDINVIEDNLLTMGKIDLQEEVISPSLNNEKNLGEYEVQVYQVQLNGGMFYNIDEALTRAKVVFQGVPKHRPRKSPPLYVNVQSGTQSTIGNFYSNVDNMEKNSKWVDKTKKDGFPLEDDLATLISEGKVKVMIDG